MNTELEFNYGHLFEKELLTEITQVATLKKIDANVKLIEIGAAINFMPLLLNGAIKILREDDKGDELLLYFIEKGDTCAMTLNCCMQASKSEIRAVTETNVELLMLPIEKMGLWMTRYKSWQNFILESYNNRLKEMLETIDTIAFLNMDERILKHLKDKAMINGTDEIKATHQEIAYDLHTSRVVVSRILKKLEKESKIAIKRNLITVKEL